MPAYSKPHGDFQNQTQIADATQVNDQINQLYTAVNGGLDGTNVPNLGDMTTVTTTAKNAAGAINELQALPVFAMSRQALINGNLEVVQRVGPLGSKTIASGSSAYVVDRFKSVNNGSGVNAIASQVAVSDLDGSSYGLQLIHSGTPTAQVDLWQIYTMEAADSYKLAGKKVTVSVKVKGVAGMNQVSLVARYNTSETSITGSSTFIANNVNVSINSAGWTTVPLTFTCPSRATLTTSGVIGIQIIGAKTTVESNGDGFIISQVQLNAGDQILPFQPRSFADELALCQRYCRALSSATVANISVGIGSANTATSANIFKDFNVQMRVPPTIVATAADWQLADGVVAPIVLTAISLSSSINSEFTTLISASVSAGLTIGRPYFLWAVAVNKRIVFDAEL